MKHRVYKLYLDDVMVMFAEKPLREYDHCLKFNFKYNDERGSGMSMSWMARESVIDLLDAIKAFAVAENREDFIQRLEAAGYHNQNEQPFATEWELERTLELAKKLRERLDK